MLAPDKAAGRVIALADRVCNLTVRRRSPHAFFEERSEIDSDLRKLAAEISGKPDVQRQKADRGSFKAGAIVHRGAVIKVETRRAGRMEPRSTGAATAPKSLLERTFG